MRTVDTGWEIPTAVADSTVDAAKVATESSRENCTCREIQLQISFVEGKDARWDTFYNVCMTKSRRNLRIAVPRCYHCNNCYLRNTYTCSCYLDNTYCQYNNCYHYLNYFLSNTYSCYHQHVCSQFKNCLHCCMWMLSQNCSYHDIWTRQKNSYCHSNCYPHNNGCSSC